MKQFSILIALTLLVAHASALQDRCNAVVLEGGGDLGAFEAGVLKGLTMYLPPEDYRWDVVAGVSVGAITSAALSQWAPGDEVAAVDWLVDFWHHVVKEDVYTNWVPGGILEGLTNKPGLFNTEALKKTIQQNVTKKPLREVAMLSCDVNTGLYHRYEEDLTLEEFQEAVLTSASVPMLFPWQELKGAQLFDGGVCKMTDISGAVLRCRDLVGGDDTKIHITLIYISRKELEPWTGKETSLDAFNRYEKIMNFRKCFRELTSAWDYYHNVNYDWVIAPSQPLPGSKFPFTFGEDRLLELINLGISDAKATIDLGIGASIQNFLEMAQKQEAEDHDIFLDSESLQIMKEGREKRHNAMLKRQMQREQAAATQL